MKCLWVGTILCAALLTVANVAEAKPKNAARKSAPAQSPAPAAQNTSRGAASPATPPHPASPREVVRQESKIEFDERMVQGQRASGAIYLFQRGESEFRSMVEIPQSFIQRTIKTILPEGAK